MDSLGGLQGILHEVSGGTYAEFHILDSRIPSVHESSI